MSKYVQLLLKACNMAFMFGDSKQYNIGRLVTKRLELKYIKAALPTTLDPHQYAYRTHRSTDEAIPTALHTVLLRLE